MRVKTIGAGPHPDMYKQAGLIEFDGLSINCAERQRDISTLVDVRAKDDQLQEGGDGAQVATIAIPPRRYRDITTDDTDSNGVPIIIREAIPLDPTTVVVTLWPYHKKDNGYDYLHA